jgi:hypothetical protein
MESVQIPGVISSAKFLLVSVIWLLIVFAVAGVISAKDYQWMPPHDLLYDGNGVLLTDLNRSDQCEQLNFKPGTLAGAVLEPQNTWSNAFYLLAGMLILACTKRPLGYLVGIQLCVLAVLSGAYHATLQDPTRTMDVAGIYFILTALLFYALQAAFVRGMSRALEWGIAGGLTIVSFVGSILMASNRSNVYLFGSTTVTFTVVCALVVLCVYEMGRKGFNLCRAVKIWKLWTRDDKSPLDYLKVWRMFSNSNQSVDWNLQSYFLFFIFIGAPGIIARLNDGDGKPFCSAGSPIQAHAIWHTFGAATLLIGYDLFAWSGGWERGDYPVFQRKQPDGKGVNDWTLIATGIAAILIGALLLVMSFKGGFVDSAHHGDSADSPRNTGLGIASCFLATGIIVLVLRLTKVLEDPRADY